MGWYGSFNSRRNWFKRACDPPAGTETPKEEEQVAGPSGGAAAASGDKAGDSKGKKKKKGKGKSDCAVTILEEWYKRACSREIFHVSCERRHAFRNLGIIIQV